MMLLSDSVGGADDSRNGYSKRIPVNVVDRSAMTSPFREKAIIDRGSLRPNPTYEGYRRHPLDRQRECCRTQVDVLAVAVLDLDLHLQDGVGCRLHFFAQMLVDVIFAPVLVLDVLHPLEIADRHAARVREDVGD